MTTPIPSDNPDIPVAPVVPGRRTNLPLSTVPAGAVAPPVRRPLTATYRLLLALAALAAVTVEILLGSPARVLSHFTVQSTLLLAVVMLASARRAWTARRPLPGALTGAALLYVIATTLGHHLLLADATPVFTTGPAGTAGLTGSAGTLAALAPHALHTVLPIAAVLDWLLLSPPARMRLAHAATWLLYPTVHLAFVLALGGLLPSGPARYPYPFQDLSQHGHPSVPGTSLLLLLALYCLAVAVIAVDRTRPGPVRLSAKTGFRLQPPVG